MLRASITLVGLAGISFLAGSFALANSEPDTFTKSKDILRVAMTQQNAVKGDRLAVWDGDVQQNTVSIVEVVGLTQATVILRGGNGEVLYRSDPRSGTTIFSKNTDLPILTMKEETQGPAVEHPPVTRREGSEEIRKPKRTTPVGCMGDVSPLARASASRMPSLCLASLEHPLI
ncbi:hypothetical protein AB4Y85_16590 [Microvirga sp. 2YAF29]|uniref:hypothetical protein n=1 Tax=Microvirga sp. 2YAF29 TaxID=3233031 RepID=UPI003F960D30